MYFDPSNSNLAGEITNKTANSCTITVWIDPYTATSSSTYTCYFNQGASPARPFSHSFPITLTAYENGFNPLSNTIVAPYTGQTYSIFYISNINNAIDWNIEVTAGGDIVTITNVVKTGDYVQFDMVVAPNTSTEIINGAIQLTKYIKLQGNTLAQTPDPFLFKIAAIAPKIDITPQSPQNFSSNGGSKSISITANYGSGINYTATVDSAASSWLSASVSQSGRSATINVTAAENKSTTANRSGNIRITYGDYSSTYTITQDTAPRIEGKIEVLDPIFNLIFMSYSGKSRVRLSNISNIKLSKNVSWIDYSKWIDSEQKNMDVYFDVKKNSKNKNRQGIITISGNDPQGDVVSNNILINQEGYNIAPICQDTYFTYDSDNNYVDYTLNTDNQLIYSGRAYKLPDTNYIRFNVNKLASPYLSSNLPDGFPNIASDSFHFYTDPHYYRDFVIKDNNKNILFEYRFFDDWSYNFENVLDRENSMGIIVLSDPIKKIVDRRQFFFYSAFLPVKPQTTSSIDIDYKLRNSKTGATKMRGYDRLGTERISLLIDHNLLSFKDYDLIDIAQDTYKIVDSCCEYAIYYRNAYGGWDSLLVEGNNLKSDKINSNSYVRSFDNNTVEFEKKKYLNVIQPKYTLYTGYLTDDEASRMWHLLESTEVYLHNLVTDEVMPANITDTTCEYKTFENQGKKKFFYTIKLDIAQEKLRK